MTLAHGKNTEPPQWGHSCLSALKGMILLPESLTLWRSELDIQCGNQSDALRGVYLGEGQSLEYFRRIYGAPVQEPRRIPIWNLRKELDRDRAGCDVVLVEINRLLGFLLPAGGCSTDSWVRLETDLGSEGYRRRQRGIERGWGQKVRRHRLCCRISRSTEDLAVFYRDYYVPYVRERHGSLCSVRSFSALRRAMRTGFLLQVWREADWVSGLVVSQNRPDLVRLLAAGLRPPYQELLQQGALSAVYYFLFRWAQEAGVRIVDFCGARPHLLDGVFRHKTLWAAEPVHDPWHHTEIVFFLSCNNELPDVITRQLVRRNGRFIMIEECRKESR